MLPGRYSGMKQARPFGRAHKSVRFAVIFRINYFCMTVMFSNTRSKRASASSIISSV